MSMRDPINRKAILVDALLGFSLANLWLLPVTKYVLVGGSYTRIDRFSVPRGMYLGAAAAMMIVTLIATAVLFIQRLPRINSTHRGLQSLSVFLAIIFVVRRLRKYGILNIANPAQRLSDLLPTVAFVALTLVLIWIVAFVYIRYSTLLQTGLHVALLTLVPFALLVTLQLLWTGFRVPGFDPPPRATRHNAERGPVLLLLFDALDARVLGSTLRPLIQLPELTKFRSTSVNLVNAKSPALETQYSIPSMLAGRVVDSMVVTRSAPLAVRFRGSSEMHPWSSVPSAFSRVSAIRGQLSVVGWYHSYCRGLAAVTASGCWTAMPIPLPDETSVIRTAGRLLKLAWHPGPSFQSAAIRRLRNVRTHVISDIESNGYDLIYAHYPVPHGPYLKTFRANGYYGNLLITDEVVGEVVNTLKKRDLWDDATVIITGDHGVPDIALGLSADLGTTRSDRVPFMIKLPHQRNGFTYYADVSTTVLSTLLPQLVVERVTDRFRLFELLRTAHVR